MLAIIGGSGLYKLSNAEILAEEIIESPFGPPSGPILRASLSQREVLFLARHGAGHGLLPSEVNYRANIFALKKAGTKAILSVSAVGSLREHIQPGDLVAVDQYLDFTKGKRQSTFFGEGLVGHIASAQPISSILHGIICEQARALKLAKRNLHELGTYVCVEGPRLGTRAESLMFRTLGADVVGMTNTPECFLAREAQIAYASLGVVTDFDSWQDDPSLHVEVSKIFSLYAEALEDVLSVIQKVSENYSESDIEKCLSRNALIQSLLTPESSWSEKSREIVEVLRQ